MTAKKKKMTKVKFSGSSDLSASALEQRTLSFTVKSDKSTLSARRRLFEDCITAKDLYNQALYIFRQNLIEATKFEEDNPGKKWKDESGKNKWLYYSDLDKIMKYQTNLDGEINYKKMLKAQCAQQCLRTLNSNIKGYVKLIKSWSKDKSKFNGMPKLPNYLSRYGVSTLLFTNQSVVLISNKSESYVCVQFAKDLRLRIPTHIWGRLRSECIEFNQVRVIPLSKSSHFANDPMIEIQIVYTIDASKKNRSSELDENTAISVDLGVDNFASIASTSGKTLLLKGKDHKSRLLHYQHKIAKAQSKLDKDRLNCLKNKRKKAKKQSNVKEVKTLDNQIKNFKSTGSTKRIQDLNRKITNLNKTYAHKTSKAIANFALQQRASKITVGKNKSWKNKSKMSRNVNQVFCSMPHSRMLQYLAYKAKELGISTVEHEESYTSKCDSLALEAIEKHTTYLGKRVKRGLFQSSTGKMVNADINGALNIGRKGLKTVFTDDCIRRLRDMGQLYCPESVHDVDLFLRGQNNLNMDSIGSKDILLNTSFN